MIIITEGGPTIGLGHLMRCIAVAQRLRDMGRDPFFIVNRKKAVSVLLAQYGFDHMRVTHIEKWSAGSAKAIKGLPVLIDTKKDVSSLIRDVQARECRVTLLDNASKAKFLADILIYPSEHADPKVMRRISAERAVYYGVRYFPLRKEFIGTRLKKRKNNIVVSMGGSDKNNLTGLVLRSLEGKMENRKVAAVIGKAFTHRKWLRSFKRKRKKFCSIDENVRDFPRMLGEAGLIITALGVTIYEAAYCRTPVLVINNYRSDAKDSARLERLGFCKAIGYHRDIKPADIVDGVTSALFSKKSVFTAPKAGVLPDAKGAQRIASLVVKRSKRPKERK